MPNVAVFRIIWRTKKVLFDDLASELKKVASSIYGWLGVDPKFEPVSDHARKVGVPKSPRLLQIIDSRSHISRLIKRYAMPKLLKEKLRERIFSSTPDRPKIDDETHKLLRDFYQKDVLQLEKLINEELPGWLETDKSGF